VKLDDDNRRFLFPSPSEGISYGNNNALLSHRIRSAHIIYNNGFSSYYIHRRVKDLSSPSAEKIRGYDAAVALRIFSVDGTKID